VAEELWEALREKPGTVRIPWPTFDPDLLKQDQIPIVIQVNGKKRSEITVPVEASEDEIKQAAMSEANVQKFVEGKTVRKMILVPGKLLNIVAS
jgi:leucyl-tRNA synthetase